LRRRVFNVYVRSVCCCTRRWSRKNRGLPPNPPKVEIDYRTGYIRSHLRSPSGRVRWPTTVVSAIAAVRASHHPRTSTATLSVVTDKLLAGKRCYNNNNNNNNNCHKNYSSRVVVATILRMFDFISLAVLLLYNVYIIWHKRYFL